MIYRTIYEIFSLSRRIYLEKRKRKMRQLNLVSELNDFIHGLGVNESEAGKYENLQKEKWVEVLI
jgi:hypothetical protein